ncbi:P-loop NTPase fold protein [Acinetobacter guillouiae]|uniref:P-loop NTPase fold protein n=1 Tax=Acinetobacter guillouiae TaxID=106649 RepID=UPI003AF950F8
MSIVSEKNKHIEEYVNYYISDKNSEFAILINGRWGTGKTWFVKKIIENKNSKHKNMAYISLNGMSNISQISSEIFKFLHPVLGSEKAKLFGRIASDSLKAAFKIDINGNDKDETNLSVSSPKLKIPDYLKINKDFTLVFDDLERCKLKLVEILGYINYFVEHENIKVIIIGNEEEVRKTSDKEGCNYNEIKEKLIGATFEYESDSDSAVSYFIEEVFSGKLLTIIKDYKFQIINVFDRVGSKNLRSLKQVLNGFKRIYNVESWGEDDDLFNKILNSYLIYALEYKAGSFNKELMDFSGKDDYEENFFKKHSIDMKYDNIFTINLWNDIVFKNIVNMNEIELSIKKNHYDIVSENPNWLKLWNFMELNDEEFITLIQAEEEKLINKKFEKSGELKHILGLIIFFNKHGIRENNISKFISFAEDNLKSMKEYKNYKEFKKSKSFNSKKAWGSYVFQSSDDPDFVGFLNKCDSIEQIKVDQMLKKESIELLEILRSDGYLFSTKISYRNNKYESDYANISILNLINYQEFYNALVNIDFKNKQSVFYGLEQRYIGSNNLLDEYSWIKELIKYCEEQYIEKKEGIEKYNLKYLIIEPLKKIQADHGF